MSSAAPNQPPEVNLSSSAVFTSSGSSSPQTVNNLPPIDRPKRWSHFFTFRKLLDHGASSLGPLKATVTEFADCIGICEDVLNGKREYEALKDELERIFKMLNQHYGEESPDITGSVESLCKDIDRDLQGVKEKLNRDRLDRFREASNDLDDVLRCYNRIRDNLHRVSLNANISTWKIVDASATDNRLDRLQPAMSACYNSAQAIELKRGPCTAGTRTGVLSQMAGWLGASSPGSVYWMNGMAGTGKTTIAYSLCEELSGGGRLAASFFCSQLLPECRDINRQIVPSIAYQLARSSLPFRSVLSETLEKDPDVHTRLSDLQFDALIAQPLRKVKDTLPESLVVVIDALDECENKESTSRVLDALLTKSEGLPVKAGDTRENDKADQPSKTLEKDPDVHTRLSDLQFDALIAQPLRQVKDTLPESLVVVIDALDECENKESTSRVLDALLTKSEGLPVKFVISSRPEPAIREKMTKQINQANSRLVLHELDKGIVQADIKTYLQAALARMQPREDQIAALVKRAGTLFIYAATVVRYISYKNFHGNCRARLENVLTASNATKKSHKDIDDLYTTVLRAALDDPELESADRDDIQQVLRTVICAPEPLTVGALSGLLGMQGAGRVHAALGPLWSVLHVSGENEMVATLHASFPDYMLDPLRSGQYHCDPRAHNQMLALRCFQCFRNMNPQFNICGLKSSFIPDDSATGLRESTERVITADVFYAARYWVVHLCSSIASPTLMQDLEEFLSVHLLLWMEVMNLKGHTSAIPKAIQQVERWNTGKEYSEDLRALIHDAWRFTTPFASSAVSKSTPHIYISMLPFWPESNPISKLYVGRTRGLTKVAGAAIAQRQHALLLTWYLDATAESPIFSPDGTRIAVAVGDRIRLLKSTDLLNQGLELARLKLARLEPANFKSSHRGFSWNLKQMLRRESEHLVLGLPGGRTSSDGSFQFSPDGTRIAFGSCKTIAIFNIQTGTMVLGPLKGLASWVSSVSFSPDGSRLVSGSQDGTICMWDAYSGELLFDQLKGHGEEIHTIKYSPNGDYIISVGRNSGILVWDSREGKVLKTLGQDGNVPFWSADISPDGMQIASACGDHGIYVWDIQTGQVVHVLGPLATKAHFRCITFVSFSHNGTWIVSGSEGGTVCMWNARTGDLALGPLEGHTGRDVFASFSPDDAYIVSSAHGRTLCLWDTRTPQTPPNILHGHTDSVQSIGVSPDGTRIVSGSNDGTVFVWDLESREIMFSLPRETFAHVRWPIEEDGFTVELVQRVSFSPDGARVLVNTRCGAFVFDASNGTPCNLYVDHIRSPSLFLLLVVFGIVALGILPIELPLACKSGSGLVVTIPLLSHALIFLMKVFEFVTEGLKMDFMSLQPPTNQLHALTCQAILITITGIRIFGDTIFGPADIFSPRISCAEFSPEGTQIVSGSADGIIRVHDTQTNRLTLVIRLPTSDELTQELSFVSFSSDGRYIFSKSRDGKPYMHDAHSGELLFDLNDPKWADVSEFSPDGNLVAESSRNAIVVTDLDDAEILFNADALRGDFVAVQFTPDSSRTAAVNDGSAHIWDARTGRLLLTLPEYQIGSVETMTFSPDGESIITGSRDGAIRITSIQHVPVQPAPRPSSLSTMSDWKLDVDGWLVDDQRRLLIWVPPDLRDRLILPRVKGILSRKGWLKLDFEEAYLGESWAKCYDPEH
ncbi:hypothetical protein RSAG8_08102, partial [Rhizoctonia solani AG-8 WAC10335]